MPDVVGLPLEELAVILEDAGGGVKIIAANEDGNPPKRPYITIRITEGDNRQQVEANELTDEGLQDFNSPGSEVVELESYGPKAKATLDRIVARLRLPTFQDRLRLLNVVFIGPLLITSVPTVIMESQTDVRAMGELRFAFTQQLTDDVGLIETVEVSGKIGDRTSVDSFVITKPQ